MTKLTFNYEIMNYKIPLKFLQIKFFRMNLLASISRNTNIIVGMI